VDKPWIKSKYGSLYIDTTHPEWKNWFISKIKEMNKYKIINGKLVNTETDQIVSDQG
jgi:hypothetical protein